MLMRSLPIVLVVALLSAILSPASSVEFDKGYTAVVYSNFNTEVRTNVVNYDDLNIATEAGGAEHNFANQAVVSALIELSNQQ
jgi:hypothetical protein